MVQARAVATSGVGVDHCTGMEGSECAANSQKVASALLQTSRQVASAWPPHRHPAKPSIHQLAKFSAAERGTAPHRPPAKVSVAERGTAPHRPHAKFSVAERASVFQKHDQSGGIHDDFGVAERASVFQQLEHTGRNPDAMREVVWKMIRPDAWHCDLLPDWDSRAHTCASAVDLASLKPELLDCGKDNKCSIEHANSFRTLQPVGALPCCSTSPFCSAPVCNAQMERKAPPACTKRTPSVNLDYMTLQEVWPAYHGYGGAYEIDIHKIFDVLASSGSQAAPFDVAFDIGANTGYFTEKMTTRTFAKNYILIEANPLVVDTLRSRWNNSDWKKRWFAEQVHPRSTLQVPNFEIIHQALSNSTGGTLDLCQTEGSLGLTAQGCTVPIATVDHVMLTSLEPMYRDIVRDARSAFVKIDTEGMDELVLRGMEKLLQETRGVNEDGTTNYLVNFLQFEYSPQLTHLAKVREDFRSYSLKTVTEFLESVGFESFMIGPRFLPLSHGSWTDEFMTFTEDPRNNMGRRETYPGFDGRIAPWCYMEDCKAKSTPTMTTDVFAIRASHPRATELKVALGACQESSDFDINDQSYMAGPEAPPTSNPSENVAELQRAIDVLVKQGLPTGPVEAKLAAAKEAAKKLSSS